LLLCSSFAFYLLCCLPADLFTFAFPLLLQRLKAKAKVKVLGRPKDCFAFLLFFSLLPLLCLLTLLCTFAFALPVDFALQ
jgi:hypothetical protein